MAVTKKFHSKREKDIVIAFKERQKEVDVVNDLILLNHFKVYSNELDEAQSDPYLNDDMIRLRGLELIQELKGNIAKAKTPPNLESLDNTLNTLG